MMESRQLTKLCGGILSEAGYERKGKTWWKRSSEVIVVFNLQKSNYSNLYYVNIGFFLLALQAMDFPKEYQCHITMRANRLFPDVAQTINGAFDLDFAELSDEDRSRQIENILRFHVLPYCDASSDLANLRASFLKGRFKHGRVLKHVRDLFGSS